jgi:Tfp pilus assembly protein PilP
VKPTAKPVSSKPVVVKTVSATPVAKKAPAKATAKAADSKPAAKDASAGNVSVEKAPEPAKNEKTKTISANGRRDPFISPVISQSAVGSGCSSGKRCLAVDQISLKGVVRSETGMIAVVVNALDKAYFLRENDPVFDGYVLKITGDSIVFKETVQDKLGKPFTKEVTKKLNTPAV